MSGRPTARLGTFDAERWWRPADLAVLPAITIGDVAPAMEELLAGFCTPGDLLLTKHTIATSLRDQLAAAGVVFDHHVVAEPGPVEAAVLRDDVALTSIEKCTTLEPYAILPGTQALPGSWPRLEIVAKVNSKVWSNDLARSLDLPGTGVVVTTVEELSDAVTVLQPAVLKDPYGVSGRGALEIRDSRTLRAVLRTLAQQVAHGMRVEFLVQRKFEVRADFSAHVEIARGGAWRFRGIRRMMNRGFRYLGSGPPNAELRRVIEDTGYLSIIERVAIALAQAGYHGPAGVDSALLADGSVVPVLEINARQSLGLLSLKLDDFAMEAAGLRAHLRQCEVSVPPGTTIDDLISCLEDISYTGGERPGVVVLNGSRLRAPGGRIYFALICTDEHVTRLREWVFDAFAAAGARPRGVFRAA